MIPLKGKSLPGGGETLRVKGKDNQNENGKIEKKIGSDHDGKTDTFSKESFFHFIPLKSILLSFLKAI